MLTRIVGEAHKCCLLKINDKSNEFGAMSALTVLGDRKGIGPAETCSIYPKDSRLESAVALILEKKAV